MLWAYIPPSSATQTWRQVFRGRQTFLIFWTLNAYFIFIPRGYVTKSGLFKSISNRSFSSNYLPQKLLNKLCKWTDKQLVFWGKLVYGIRIQYHRCLPDFSGRFRNNPEWWLFTFFLKFCICVFFKKWFGEEWMVLM